MTTTCWLSTADRDSVANVKMETGYNGIVAGKNCVFCLILIHPSFWAHEWHWWAASLRPMAICGQLKLWFIRSFIPCFLGRFPGVQNLDRCSILALKFWDYILQRFMNWCNFDRKCALDFYQHCLYVWSGQLRGLLGFVKFSEAVYPFTLFRIQFFVEDEGLFLSQTWDLWILVIWISTTIICGTSSEG